MGGYVDKLGVLQACPHIHADPLLIHQAALSKPSHTGCLVLAPRCGGSVQAMQPGVIARERLKWALLMEPYSRLVLGLT